MRSSANGGPALTARVLVAGIGNLFCRDDGFGPEVVRRLLATGSLPEQVRAVDYGIRGMHLAYDLLEGYDALVLVDAVPGNGEPGEVSVLEVGEEHLGAGGFDPHGMAPVAMLASLKDLGGQLPTTYVVGCRPADVGDGIGLSEQVEAAVPVAIETIERPAPRADPGLRPNRRSADMCLGIPGQGRGGDGRQRRHARRRRRPGCPTADQPRHARRHGGHARRVGADPHGLRARADRRGEGHGKRVRAWR